MTDLNQEALEKAQDETRGNIPPTMLEAAIRTYLASLPPVDAEPVPSDLVERLREFAAGCRGSMWQSREETIRLCEQAAAAIIASQGERDRLFDDQQPMACEAGKMTAAEDVLAWLLIEKIGVPDDCFYTPHQAQKIIETEINRAEAAEAEVARLKDELAEAHRVIGVCIDAFEATDHHYRTNIEEQALRRARSFRDGQKTGEIG